jgi:hypothetical protein
MNFTRRDLGRLMAAGLLLPRELLAAADVSRRKFMFIFCAGGWDPTYVFTPYLSDPDIWMDPGATPTEGGGIPYLSAEERPAVDSFFSSWGDRTAIVNGIEVRSVTHEACRRIIWTGGTDSAADDWAAKIAGNSDDSWALPDLVISGPAFSAEHSSSVMRVGPDGQLGKLVTGYALDASDQPASPLSTATTSVVEEFLATRAEALVASARPGPNSDFAHDYMDALDRLDAVRDIGEDLSLASLTDDYQYVRDRVRPAIRLLAEDRSRCVVVQHLGQWDAGWDTHSNIAKQNDHFQFLFDDLNGILGELAVTTTASGGMLLDEVTVVVLSEMGRAPWMNTLGGKDHWTFTTAMLIGAGIRGGTVAGEYGEGLVGAPVDLETGLAAATGTRMTSKHLGATLATIGGLDPELVAPGTEPIRGILAD